MVMFLGMAIVLYVLLIIIFWSIFLLVTDETVEVALLFAVLWPLVVAAFIVNHIPYFNREEDDT